MLALERENMWATSTFLPVAVAVGFPEQCGSRTVPEGLQRLFSQGVTALDRVVTMRAHRPAKFSIFAFVISCGWEETVRFITEGVGGFLFNLQLRRITSVPSKVSQTQFFLTPPSCQWITKFRPISWSHRGFKGFTFSFPCFLPLFLPWHGWGSCLCCNMLH